MGPLVTDLGIRGAPADTAIDVTASVEGVVGQMKLVVEVPAGVTLTQASGDWTSCTQSGTTITCVAAGAQDATWSGSLHTAWTAAAHGVVRATVTGTYANGSPAHGSIQATWPP